MLLDISRHRAVTDWGRGVHARRDVAGWPQRARPL